MRADKYLHHIRVFKTRGLATQACEKSNVLVNGAAVKPARDLRAGDVLDVQRGELRLKLEVLAFPASRVGAPHVQEFCRNFTSPEAYERAAEVRRQHEMTRTFPHDHLTKPDKKQMRALREWLGRDES